MRGFLSCSEECELVSTAPVESPDTAVEVETPPEPQLAAAPEVSIEAPPATEMASAPEETEIVDPLAEFEPEKVKELPSVKALLESATKDVEARQAESYRQKTQAAEAEAERKANAAAYQRQQDELAAIDNGSARDALYRALAEVIPNDPDAAARLAAKMPELGQMAQTITRSTQTRVDRTYVEATNEYLTENYPDYKIAPDLVSKFDAALAKGDFKARHAILLDIVKDAAVSAATPALRAAAIRDVKAEAEKTLTLQKQQQSERAAAQNGGPTAVAGRPAAVGNYRNLAEVAAAHVAGELTNAQVRAYRAMPRSQMPEY